MSSEPKGAGARGNVLIGKLAVYGVGLIGGSFALALKAAGAVSRVTGVGRGRATSKPRSQRA